MRVMKPHQPDPVPVDTYIDALWRAVKAEYITWEELRELQATYLRTKQPVPMPAAPVARKQRS